VVAAVALLGVAAGGCDDDDHGARDDVRRVQRERAKLARERAEVERDLAVLAVERRVAEEERRRGIELSLPAGSSHDIDLARATVVVMVTTDGRLVIEGKVVADDDLDRVFARASAADDQAQVVIHADQGTPHRAVVAVMERARAAGLTRLAIATRGR
jgi:biopolymer transport protein ExbD